MPVTAAGIDARAARVAMLLLDVDGTLTDGGLYYLSDGGLAVRFHVRDGLGIALARRAGLVVGLVSGRDAPQVRARAAELQLDEVHLGIRDKKAVLEEICARRGLDPATVCFVGDDLVDVPAMELCGLAVAVADAMPGVRAAAHWVTESPGGNGAVREVVDRILAARD
jgi:3-deoxy-D-manno-octulosonate 8-phosphate phosphatase (KDO 8-P phosphatase)